MIKETIIAALQRAGYDTMTACELAYAKVQELKRSAPGRYTFQAGNESITVDVKG